MSKRKKRKPAKKQKKQKAIEAHALIAPAVAGLIERTREAAGRVVTQRQDAEAVHDFRVGMRRMRTVLRACRGLYGHKRVVWAEAELKHFGDLTSALRDEEVLEETLAPLTLSEGTRDGIRAWLTARGAHEGDLREAAIAEIAGPRLEACFDAIAARIGKGPTQPESAGHFAARQLEAVQQGVAARLPVSRADVEGLHRLRIRYKRMRYTAEMLGRFISQVDAADALRTGGKKVPKAATNFAAVARLAARMQKRLGQLHDADAALETLASASDLDPTVRREALDALGAHRDVLVDKSIDDLEKLPSSLRGGKPALVPAPQAQGVDAPQASAPEAPASTDGKSPPAQS